VNTLHQKYNIESLIEIWKKSITIDAIPPQLNNRSEIEKYGKDYQEVIQVGNDHYGLSKRWSSKGPDGDQNYWEYQLMSNAEWERYYKKFISDFSIEDYLILK